MAAQAKSSKQKTIPPVSDVIQRAEHILITRDMEGKEIPRFSKKYETVTDYLKSPEFKDSKPSFQKRVLKQAMEHPEWDLADARGHSKTTGKTFQFFDDEGLIPGGIQFKSRKEESLYAKYLNDLKNYLKTGDEKHLAKWNNKTLRDKDGNKLPFVTDKDVIDDLARFSQLPSGADIYEL